MGKKILVIGGTAFTGRVFSIQMSKKEDIELHVVNRGQYPLNLSNVKEYKCDRHSPRMLARLVPAGPFDAVIDFCALSAGDVSSLLEALKGRINHYIMFSCASVYEPYGETGKKETDPLVIPAQGDRESDQITNKILLEQETVALCRKLDIPYTILRPAFIYGPFSRSGRESYFVELIARGHVVPVPTDATSRFSMVYNFDIARALELLIGSEKAYNQIFNLSAPEEITCNLMLEAFETFNGGPFMTRPVTIDEILDENIPTPFPLTENELFSGQKFTEMFDFEYTPFMEGMEKTFKIFYSLFIS
jgi:nucleoside-diphosphate-sugar epimerase